ncbi:MULTISPECIES: CCA tRNA nucleotidyltransferase [Agrobacterium tumefaciens complex]|jgi:poly(A) polymerase|uniref:CCA tRNA nucleotidyltransferase n=1 Tax=Agrobacterium radiobacter TaxID=362 RepID=A0ABD5LK87_AGRRD|nr:MULTISPECIES: CCA tRNA nucleotidyltransferase [Agrobacterium tumefaciens complex]MCP2134034.1 poly(A) polymerase [Rhizobium sp. SLBN-94]TGE80635.1 CCA tRNA nucleotidyltransferase [Rhizobium sp. SEMIA 439]EPR22881.1 poly(A) polymerase [Agrobacterium radiobacter DSM 30147]KAA1237530.1 CCA tRNA nucleotidyltransferase [Agrobacterium tumefaciens]KAB0460568.1 CCA tRNA nucleotidyltransferase [Agrobacterium tumefaciens]
MSSLAGRDWFEKPALKRIFALLNADGGEVRIVGGAVRNALMDLPVVDVDLATTLTPDVVVARAKAAGIKAVPTGIEHGTVTLVIDGEGFEVTTLRRDVETNGRHAQVAFGTDWQTDAERRDLTINALYADEKGEIIDLIDGLPDIETGTVRFIGDAAMRISEDYLRILRFFRFFAHYGSGRPDADGLRASARAKDKLGTLSAERVWSELKKLLSARDPSRALLWMRQSGVLTEILPETEKWGIDAIHGLVATEQALGWAVDPMLRLSAILPPDRDRLVALAARLRLSKAEAAYLTYWASAPAADPELKETALDRLLYRQGVEGVKTRLKLALVAARADVSAGDTAMQKVARLSTLLARAEKFHKPGFPLSGVDVMAAGVEAGPKVGEVLKSLEEKWIDVNFSLDRAALTARLKDMLEN